MTTEALIGYYKESVFTTELNKFKKGIKSRLRFIVNVTAGRKETFKDPVYSSINKRNSFEDQFILSTFYLTSRYLPNDDINLYRKIDKLYKTRSKIVHTGHVSETHPHFLEINFEGAQEAIDTAKTFASWLGIDLNFVSPGQTKRIKMIKT